MFMTGTPGSHHLDPISSSSLTRLSRAARSTCFRESMQSLPFLRLRFPCERKRDTQEQGRKRDRFPLTRPVLGAV